MNEHKSGQKLLKNEARSRETPREGWKRAFRDAIVGKNKLVDKDKNWQSESKH